MFCCSRSFVKKEGYTRSHRCLPRCCGEATGHPAATAPTDVLVATVRAVPCLSDGSAAAKRQRWTFFRSTGVASSLLCSTSLFRVSNALICSISCRASNAQIYPIYSVE